MTRSRMFQHAFLLFHLSAAPLTLGFICSRVLESCRLPTSRSTNLRSRPLTAASNGGFSDGIGFIADFIVSQREWYNFGNCLVLFPPENVPKSVVHFVGGFVAGSAATVTYGTMLSCLAANGHLIVVTPTPAVESNHGKVAADVSASFTECYNQNLRPILGPIGEDLPIFGLSHSLGGKLTVLLNSRKQDRRRIPPRSGNIFLAFNNYGIQQNAELIKSQASRSSPELRGLLEDTPIVKDLLSSLFGKQGTPSASSSSQPWSDPNAGKNQPWSDPNAPTSASTAINELAQTFGEQLKQIVTKEVADRVSAEMLELDFTPGPEQTWQLLLDGYNVQKNVIMKFVGDEIDQSIELSNYLRTRGCDSVLQLMPGNHLTPNSLTPGSAKTDPDMQKFLKELTRTLNTMAIEAWSEADVARREKYRLPSVVGRPKPGSNGRWDSDNF